MPPIGSHATVTGGLATGALAYAAAVDAEVIQVFVSNPRGWAAGPGSTAEDARLREAAMPVFIHATYMINLGSGNPEVAAKSADAVAHALQRGGEIGARGVVVHTGSAVGWDRDRALRQLAELTLPLLDKLADDDPDLLFEPMAGQGQMLCAQAGDLAEYLTALEFHPKAGVCLDTCHVFAAGHDLTADGGVSAMLTELSAASAGDRVKLVHANDSVLGCGTKRDRHAAIGAGQIGAAPFQELLAALPEVPFVVETPGGKAGHARDIATLKGLREQ
ncbi:MAG TPA: deoxyribonuclease IV [Trebonia sp.]|nr:deoxyribonuclease IV [Trebonia sp.]